MANSIWTNVTFRLSVIWMDLFILTIVLIYHSYRLCCVNKARKGSPIRLLGYISFKHLSFIVIIAAILPAMQQAIVYTPQQPISNGVCRFTVIFGITFLAFAKLALHLFVTVRSQVIRSETTSIWFKIGLTMILSDILYITYILSGIPTIESMQHGVLCKVTKISLPVYIWFAMNDFIIGCYCLLAFIVPLRKYVLLEESIADAEESTVQNGSINRTKNDRELRVLIKKIMAYSSVALVSTIIITVVSSLVNESGGALFGIDSVINAICVSVQFTNRNLNTNASFMFCPWNIMQRALQIEIQTPPSKLSTPPTNTNNNVSMVIHAVPKAKPQLKDNVSLSLSLVENQDMIDL